MSAYHQIGYTRIVTTMVLFLDILLQEHSLPEITSQVIIIVM